MAMKRYQPDEFYSELVRRGCSRDEDLGDLGTTWAHDEKYFLVPPQMAMGSILIGC